MYNPSFEFKPSYNILWHLGAKQFTCLSQILCSLIKRKSTLSFRLVDVCFFCTTSFPRNKPLVVTLPTDQDHRIIQQFSCEGISTGSSIPVLNPGYYLTERIPVGYLYRSCKLTVHNYILLGYHKNAFRNLWGPDVEGFLLTWVEQRNISNS